MEDIGKKVNDEFIKIEVKKGQKCSICTCGNSKTIPYCDNSHRKVNEENNTSYKSLKIIPDEDTIIYVYSNNWRS